MAEAADDLSTPLGQGTAARRTRRFRLPFSVKQAVAVLLGLFLATFVGFALFNDDPLGGEPKARIVLRQSAPEAAKPSDHPLAETKAPAKPPQTSSGGQQTITVIDGSSGKRQDFVIGGDAAAKDGGEPAKVSMAGIDQRLLEKSRYGMIPVAADGLKPFTVYAAEADRAKAAKMPVVAIVIGGLGIGAAKTADAIMKLLPAVTLAFTPYGAEPSKLTERARAQRHEILLQVPMEPFDYPDNDPGPQTLLSTLGAEQNMDRLHWHLSRFQGYAGIANFMGARFVVSDNVMQPTVREAAKRGLGYFDDGTAPRSVAASLATSQAMPFARADLTIDAVPTALEIDRALAKLETMARERGTAVGLASALPISIERLAVWCKALEGRGILLVPLTTAMLKSKSN